MVAVPCATPVTIPVPEPILAIVLSLVLHAPKAVTSLKLVVAPTQAFVGPTIGAGVDVIFSLIVVMQPVGNI